MTADNVKGDDVDADGPTVKPDQRLRYPAPTIDLKATEIPNDSEIAGTAAHPIEEPSVSTSASNDRSSADGERASDAASHIASGASQRQPAEGTRTSSGDGNGSPPRDRRFSALPFEPAWQLLAAGAASGAIVLLLLIALWSAGLLGGNEDMRSLNARLQRVEAQLGNGSSRGNVDLANRLSAAEATIKSLADDVANLNRRMDGIAARATQDGGNGISAASQSDIDDLSQRVATLEATTRNLQGQVAKALAKSSDVDDHAARFAVLATALRLAVESGNPFAGELAQARRFIADPQQLAVLDQLAAEGVPTPHALAREFSSLSPTMLAAANVPYRDGGFVSRLVANAEHLVRIRPLEEETPGDEPATVILRVELKSTRGDIAGALAELAKLPTDVRAPAQAWAMKAQARESAVGAARQISSDAVAALAASSG
jgi:hypothetical protein